MPLGKNVGFAGALNRGVGAARGEYVLLLNNDMRFDPDFIKKLAAPLSLDISVFASDGLQFDWAGQNIVHAATFLGRPNGNGQAVLSCQESIPGVFIRQEIRKEPTEVLMASGANLMCRRKMFLELGGLDDRYPIGHEDTDICWRAWLRGWKSLFVPSAVCWHDVGRSSRISTEGARFRFRGTVGGRLVFAWKLLPWRFVCPLEGRLLLGILKDAVLFRWDRVVDRARVCWQHVKQVPSLWRERGTLFRSGHGPKTYFDKLLGLGREGS
jgi:GT2 family glycosyltransferase